MNPSGGKRDGAGRPPVSGITGKRVNIYVSGEAVLFLPKTNVSGKISRMITLKHHLDQSMKILEKEINCSITIKKKHARASLLKNIPSWMRYFHIESGAMPDAVAGDPIIHGENIAISRDEVIAMMLLNYYRINDLVFHGVVTEYLDAAVQIVKYRLNRMADEYDHSNP